MPHEKKDALHSPEKVTVSVITMPFAEAMEMNGDDIKHTMAVLFPKRRKGLVAVVRINTHLTLREKCRIQLPALDLSKYDARLHSVDQLLVDHAIIGYQGVFKEDMLRLAKRLAMVSAQENLNGGLFPGYPLPTGESRYWTEFTENLPGNWAHVRLVRNARADTLLLAEGAVVRSISLTSVLDGDLSFTRTEMVFESEVVFIDRTTNNGEKVLVVTEDCLYLLDLVTRTTERVKGQPYESHEKIVAYFRGREHATTLVGINKAVELNPF